jgi:Uncharacterised nucleotidyltransferase
MLMTGRALQCLVVGLKGHPPADDQWPKVLEIANRGWLAPALYLALSRAFQLEQIPAPVREYLAFLHERNRERNLRLRAQLVEAVRALNATMTEPILLKGAIHLFTAPDENLGSRMMSDLDLCVASSEMEHARMALEALGYCDALNTRGMGRPDCVGLIELRDKPSSRSSPYLSADLRSASVAVEHDGATARVPSATCRALHLIVHDMIKEGDYWRWRMDLRHLHDLAELAAMAEGVDWQQISATMSSGRPAHRALEVQATALREFFGVPIPPWLRARKMARLMHAGRMIAATGGAIGAPARFAGNLMWGVHRFATAQSHKRGWDFAQRVYRTFTELPKGSRL